MSVFLNQSAPSYNLFGVMEARFDFRISDQDVNIPDYRIQRKDSTAVGQTGIAVYIHDSIADITHRRHDLESDCVQCIWLELKPNANAPSLFVCFLYRNPSVCYEWFDDFVQMIDNLRAAKSHADILLLGDFNIDLLKPHSSWDSTITLLGLTQLIVSPTRITPTSATLIDHIYTNNPDAFTDVSVSDLSISDHCPISCTKFVKLSKCKLKTHSLISFRSFKHFNKTAFCADLNCAPFISVLNYTDPEEALSVWYNVYLSVINRHAPLKHKRVKHPKLPPWLNKDVMQLMAERDKLKKEKRFSQYKKLRNKFKKSGEKSKKGLLPETH